MRFPAVFAIVFALCGAYFSFARADEIADAKAALDKHKLKSSGLNMILADEAEFLKALEKSTLHRKNLVVATKANDAIEQLMNEGKQYAANLKVQEVQLSAQLANVKTVAENNKLVGALRSISGQMELVQQKRDEVETKAKETRGKLNQAREDFIQFTLDLRKQADKLAADYAAKQADPEVVAAIELAEKAAKRDYTFGPSPAVASALKKLKALEDTVLSESIPLRSQGSTYFVSVVVNGKHTQEMVLDSGASTLALPHKVALAFGLEVVSTDPEVRLVLADGSEIRGRRKTLKSVRVGKFTVDEVECVVLGPEAVAAEPLLGMSFLGHFKFEVNAAASTLTMVKVASEATK